VARRIVLTVGEAVAYDVVLELGSASTVVVVSAEIPVIHPDQTQQPNIIETGQVENPPNVTRGSPPKAYGLISSMA
jgi:hypothetical protein